MVMPNDEELEEGRGEIVPAYRVVPEPVPEPVPEQATEPEPEEEEPESEYPEAGLTAEDREALFGVDGVADIGEADDLSDLVEVTDEDIFGTDETEPQPKPKPKKLYYRRTSQPYTPPETGMGGLRY